MPDINSVTFDLSDCKLVEESEAHRMWASATGVYHNLRVSPQPPAWPFDLRDCAAAADFYARQCAENKGVMLEMAVIQVGQLSALRGLFKYRSPVPKCLAMMFVHILWIPFKGWTVQLNVESVEAGTTGMREAAAMLIEGDKWPLPSSTEAPIEIGSPDDMFDQMRSQPLRALPSDGEKYDETFPDHPLSKVRRRMAEVISSLAVSVQPNDLAPFRKAAWWRRLFK
jgi:hypothetical protein